MTGDAMTLDRRTVTRCLAALGAGWAVPAFAQGKTVEVEMNQSPRMVFEPASVTIAVGDTVKWTNPFNITHTVTFDPAQAIKASDVVLPAGVAPFGSGDIEEEASYSHTFTVKGTYKYVCKYHEEMGMVGTVIVT
jgi:plastocyanin